MLTEGQQKGAILNLSDTWLPGDVNNTSKT